MACAQGHSNKHRVGGLVKNKPYLRVSKEWEVTKQAIERRWRGLDETKCFV